MSLISRLGVVLGLDAGEFNKNLGIAQERLKGFNQSIISSRLGVAAIGATFVAAATNAVRFADSINDVAQASELSVQTVLRLNEALVTNGGKADAASQMVTKFSRSVYEANHQNEDMQKAFQKLGISMEDLRTKSMEQLLSKGLKGFKELRDVTERTGIAFDVFGRSAKSVDLGGAALTFERNKESYKDAQKAFEAIGNALDNLQRISDTMKTSFAIAVGGAFEYITDKAIAFYNMMAKIKNFLNENLGAFAKFVPGAIYMPNQEIATKPKGDKRAEEEINREQEINKEILKRMKMQEEFYKKELQISEAKRQRNQKEAELVFLTENEKKLQLDLFDIEQKRRLLVLENKMNKEQAAEWAQSEKKRAQEEYNTAESQRSFEFGWKKAYASYVDTATNAAKMGEQAFVSVTSNMESALDQFTTTGKLKFGDLARSIIADLIKIQMRAQLTSMFGALGKIFGFGGGGGGGSGLFATAPSAGGLKLAFADGGEPPVGMASLVGERGPELFVPKTAGTIIPNNKLGSMGGGPQVVYNGPYIASMSAIDTQSATQFLAKNKNAVFAANQSATRSLPQSRT
jgi:lambda family phage tail tape measure protein